MCSPLVNGILALRQKKQPKCCKSHVATVLVLFWGGVRLMLLVIGLVRRFFNKWRTPESQVENYSYLLNSRVQARKQYKATKSRGKSNKLLWNNTIPWRIKQEHQKTCFWIQNHFQTIPKPELSEKPATTAKNTILYYFVWPVRNINYISPSEKPQQRTSACGLRAALQNHHSDSSGKAEDEADDEAPEQTRWI